MSHSGSSIQLRRLVWVGPLAVIASIVGVLVVRIVAVALLQPQPMPMSLMYACLNTLRMSPVHPAVLQDRSWLFYMGIFMRLII